MTQVPGPSQRPVDAPVVPGDASTPDSPATVRTAPAPGRWESRPTRPDHPVGWYRTMEPAWATEHFGFPADPKRDDEWTAEDGSVWVFALTGTVWWEMSQYPPAPFRLKLEELVAKRTWPAEAVDDFLADTELLDALAAYLHQRRLPFAHIVMDANTVMVPKGMRNVDLVSTREEAEDILADREEQAIADAQWHKGTRYLIGEIHPVRDTKGESNAD